MHVDRYSDGSRVEDVGPVGWACEVIHAGQRWRESGVLISPSLVLAEVYAATRGVELALAHGATALDVFVDAQVILDLLAGRAQRLLVAAPLLKSCVAQLQGWHATHAIVFHKIKSHHGGSSGNTWVDHAARAAVYAQRTPRKRRRS